MLLRARDQLAQAGDPRPEELARPEDSALHGLARLPDGNRDGRHVPGPAQVELEDLTVGRADLAIEHVEATRQDPGRVDLAIDGGLAGRNRQLPGLVERHDVAMASAPAIRDLVFRDAEDPRAERRAPLESVDRARDFDEYVLTQILGLGWISETPQREGIHSAGEPVVCRSERVGVPRLHAGHEVPLRGPLCRCEGRRDARVGGRVDGRERGQQGGLLDLRGRDSVRENGAYRPRNQGVVYAWIAGCHLGFVVSSEDAPIRARSGRRFPGALAR
jgi:hypothetical protein